VTFLTAVPHIMAGYHEQQLPVPSVVFPIVALSVFALLGFVAWSYRDVANRHNGKPTRGGGQHGPTV
jgi:hypothetical protein